MGELRILASWLAGYTLYIGIIFNGQNFHRFHGFKQDHRNYSTINHEWLQKCTE